MTRIVFLGTPTFAVIPLEALVAAGFAVVGVVTQPDRPAGRQRVLTPPPVKVAAERLGIPVLQPETLRDPAAIAALSDLQPAVGIVAAYGEILRKAVLAIPPFGYLNIHPSLLPLHRGPTPVNGAILAGDDETGVTVMKLDAGMDSGPILSQQRFPLPPDARAGALTDELFHIGSRMLVEALPPYLQGTLIPQPQDASLATFTKMLQKEDGVINWHHSAIEIERAIRAYDPWPGTVTTWRGQSFKILAATPHAAPSGNVVPGTLLSLKPLPTVATGKGTLTLEIVQPAGRRAMHGDEWARGVGEGAVGSLFGEL